MMIKLLQRIMVMGVFILSAAMFLAVIAQVVFRYVIQQPLPWSEELARYLMIWVACLAGAEAYRMKNHVGIDFIANLLPAAPRRWIVQIANLAVFFLMAVIIYQGFKLSWMLRDQESPALQIQMSWPYLAVPVGALVTGAYALIFFIRELRTGSPRSGS